MALYNTCKRMIERGQTAGMAKKLDIFYAANKLTDEQYAELTEMLKEKDSAEKADQLKQELKNQNGTLEHGNADLLRPVPGGRDARGDPRLQRNQHGDEPDRRPDRKPGHLL